MSASGPDNRRAGASTALPSTQEQQAQPLYVLRDSWRAALHAYAVYMQAPDGPERDAAAEAYLDARQRHLAAVCAYTEAAGDRPPTRRSVARDP